VAECEQEESLEGLVADNRTELSLEEIVGGPAEAQTLAATVSQRLRRLILDGQLPPGTTLRLSRLAVSLGVSVQPVREALRRLEAEGLVVLTPRRGATVAELSVADAEETYALRVALESLCAGRAARRLADADIAELGRLFKRMESAEKAGELTSFIDADHAFHGYLYGVSGSSRLTRMIAELQERSRRYLPSLYEAWQTVEDPLDAHRPLLAAIEDRDPARVEALTREHMTQAGERLLLAIERKAEERRSVRAPRRKRWRVVPPDPGAGTG
jgi:DNA-binding GntR family transcriptional regulator